MLLQHMNMMNLQTSWNIFLLDHEMIFYDYYTEEEMKEIVAEIYDIFGKPPKWNRINCALVNVFSLYDIFALFLEVISSLAYHAWWVGQVNHLLKADDNVYQTN